MTVSSEPRCHIVFVPIAAWGHARPMCSLVARLALTRPLTITYFIPEVLYDRIDTELSRNFDSKQQHIRSRIRLVALPCSEDNTFNSDIFYGALTETYKQLVTEKAISCAHTGKTVAGVRAPDAMILDVFALPALRIARTISQKVRVYTFTPTSASPAYRVVSLHRGDLEKENLRENLEREADESGQSLAEYTKQRYHTPTGKVMNVPGLPLIYDYEMFPQETMTATASGGLIALSVLETLNECDGLLVSAPACFETKESLEGFSAWLGIKGRKVYGVGPLLPRTEHAMEQEKTLSPDSSKIEDFMGKALKTSGPKSMIFMSFGSLFWPANPSKVWVFLEVLIDRKIPFIFSHGAKGVKIPSDVSEKAHSSGYGLLTSWAPQQCILAHPATGWFVTHAGFNSVIESITAGVPMICWPQRAEQPLNTVHLTVNLDVAYELVEVRTGEYANRPVYRTGKIPIGSPEAIRTEANEILSKAFGKDGEIKRANLLKLREEAFKAWQEGGSSWQDANALLDDMNA